jgi:malate dehydrogenase (oxaloacetate-decarboxylating)(NADP+)
VQAIAALAQAEQNDVVAMAYGSSNMSFGPEYLIPKPFDPRLIVRIASAVAQAAISDGVATRPLADMETYKTNLQQFVYHSGSFMKPLFSVAKKADRKRIVYAEGEEERVLRAVQVILDEELAIPTLIGRPAIIQKRIERFGLRMRPGVDITIVNPEFDPRYRDFWETYHRMTARKGVSAQYAQVEMRRRHTLIGAMLIKKDFADGMICGTFGTTALHLHYIDQVIGRRTNVNCYAAMNGLMLPGRTVFLVDTHVNLDPTAQEIAEMTLMAAAEMRRFGLLPKVALLSHSNFGSSNAPSAVKMREVLALLQTRAPELEVDGEMHGDCALDDSLRNSILSTSTLRGEANLLVFPNMDAANISYNLLKVAAGNNIALGPILLGARAPIHILTASTTVRRIVNMTALTVLDINAERV